MFLCEICNKTVTNITSHNKSQAHILKSNTIKQEQVSDNTLKNRDTAKKAVDTIIEENNIDIKNYKMVFNCLREKYALSTSIAYYKSGYLFNYDKLFTKKEYNQIHVFILNINDEIVNEKLLKDNEEPPRILLKDIDLTKINKDEDKKLISLYTSLPLRITEFLNIKVFDNFNLDTMDNEYNYIMLSNKTLYINKSKTNAYDEIVLKDDIIDKVTILNTINKNVTIYNNKTPRAFEKVLKPLNLTTQLLRKMYAEEYPDKVYASRILQHNFKTHVTTYRKIQ